MSNIELKQIRAIDEGTPNQVYLNNGFEHESITQDSAMAVQERIPENDTYVPRSEEIPTGDEYNAYQRAITRLQRCVSDRYTQNKNAIWNATGIVILLLYLAYCGWAFSYRFGDEASWRLFGFTIFGISLLIGHKVVNMRRSQIQHWWNGTRAFRQSKSVNRMNIFVKWLLRVGVLLTLVIYVIIDIAVSHPENLISLVGLILYVVVCYITSKNPAKVNWHTVFWGIALQYVFALLILRTKWGHDIFKWTGDRVTEFLEYTLAGVLFIYGKDYYLHVFAMKVLSIVIFFFAVINILYYIGVMQVIIRVLGRFLAFCMQTTPAESINAAANIFLSMTDSPLLIKPFLNDMTKSELHAVMTGGFATIAGSVLGAYIEYGVPANHLLSASVMSAPAALAISKLSYPETEQSKGSNTDFSKMEKSPENNVVEAASNGATSSIRIVGSIAANVLAFLSLLAFLNATLTWFGDRVGIEKFTFEYICSYILYPVAYFMGIEPSDCRKVAELVGIKTFTNEFIAYGELRHLIQNRKDLTNYTEFFNNTGYWFWKKDNIVLNITGQVLKGGVISDKTVIITTYALCGFSNFGSIGITLGALSALAPNRKRDFTQMVVRAMICGNVACFLTACIAGLLYKPF